MSVRINLLPQESVAKQRAGRARAGVALGGVVLAAALGGVYVWENGRVDAASDQVDAEQETLTALQADLAELSEFRELDTRRQQSADVVAFAMGGEAGVAGLMQDFASVFPPETELDTFTINLGPDQQPTLGDTRPAEGGLVLSGRTLRGHAPGVERLMLELDKLAAMGDLFFTNSSVEEETGDILFSVEADLGSEIFTRRYLAGLPEELR